jgi:hypothetical protein
MSGQNGDRNSHAGMSKEQAEDERQSEQHFHEWMTTATRFFVLANAGGAVATLSFIGTSLGQGVKRGWAVVSLAFFFLGVVVAGVVIAGQLTAAYRRLLGGHLDPIAAEVSIQKSWVTRYADRAEPITGRLLASAFGCFVLGGMVGIAALACS